MSFSLRRNIMFAVLSLVYMPVFLHAVVMTVVAKDLMREMNLTPEGMGLLGSAYLYAYAPAVLLSGIVAAWAGPRLTLSVLFLVSGIGGLVFAASESLPLAMVGRALCALGLSATMTSSFTLFGRWYSASSYSRVCSYFFAIGGLGALLGISLLSFLNTALGWRTVFLVVGLLTIFYGLLTFLAVRDWPPPGADITPGKSGRMRREDTTVVAMWGGIRQVVKRKDFWKLIGWFSTMPAIYFTFIGLWAIPYLRDVYAMSENEAGVLVSLVAFGFIVGSPLVSWLGDNVVKSYRLIIGASGVLIVVMVAYMLLFIDSMGRASIVALILGCGLSLNAPNACTYAAARCLFGTRMAGMTGGVFACSGFVGGAILQVVSGAILTYAQSRQWEPAAGYALAFAPFLLLGAVAAVTGFTLSPETDRSLRQ